MVPQRQPLFAEAGVPPNRQAAVKRAECNRRQMVKIRNIREKNRSSEGESAKSGRHQRACKVLYTGPIPVAASRLSPVKSAALLRTALESKPDGENPDGARGVLRPFCDRLDSAGDCSLWMGAKDPMG